MSNAVTHQMASAVGVAALMAADEQSRAGSVNGETIAAGGFVGLMSARLPDILEPALRNPNHRQFFHSFAFAGLVGYGLVHAYRWQPEDGLQHICRFLALGVGAAYLIHLLCDAGTPRGLPLVGKL